jgi:hypothetical protein
MTICGHCLAFFAARFPSSGSLRRRPVCLRFLSRFLFFMKMFCHV